MRARWKVMAATLALALTTAPSAIAESGAADAEDGAGPEDAGILTQPPASAHRFIGPTGELTVAAGATETWTFTVPDHATIADLDLGVEVSIANARDLTVALEHDSPTLGMVAITVIDRPGDPGNECVGDDVDVALSDEAAVDVEDGCTATTPTLLGRFAPATALSAFDGRDVRGDWTLTVTNDSSDDAVVDSWALHVRAQAGFDAGLVHADSPANVTDVSDKLWATGEFDAVWSWSTQLATPSLADLEEFDAVLVWFNSSPVDEELLGDRLAGYVDGGGGVVLAMFSHGVGGSIGGAIAQEPYVVMTGTANEQGVTESEDLILSTHPVFDDGGSLTGPTRATGTAVASGAYVIAKWSGGEPLVATRATVDGRIIGLNFWPVSSDADVSGWDATTDGAEIMANALVWSTTNVVLCAGLPPTREGGPKADVIDGTAGVDVIMGRGGNDTIRGFGGADVICGGNGDDNLRGNGGRDDVRGQGGADDIRGGTDDDVIRGNGGGDTLRGQGGDDDVRGGAGNDVMQGNSGADTLRGNGGADEILGGNGADVLYGYAGADTLRGQAGADELRGGNGNDDLFGGDGNDDLYGGPGQDLLSGGPGNDTCVGGESLSSC